MHILSKLNIEEPVRSRRKGDVEELDQYFLDPIIHRQIKGDKVYVPLNLSKLWPTL